MLRLLRRVGQTILIGDNVSVTLVAAENGRAELSIAAPRELRVMRRELVVESSAPATSTPAAARDLRRRSR